MIVLELPEELVEQVARRALELIHEQEPESDEWLTSKQAADNSP